jgi:hypothetical protein
VQSDTNNPQWTEDLTSRSKFSNMTIAQSERLFVEHTEKNV